jgi:EAL domain-containing protein (putative c-di-GMP-specific phosphodiesterase class I)
LTNVLKQADAACYEAKDQGRNRAHIVYKQDDVWVVERHGEMQWVSEIEHALAEGSFCLYYQTIAPLMNTPTEGIHYELLLRMTDSRGDVIGPGAFRGAAEHYNLSVKLDRWVVHEALRGLSRYPDFVESVAQCSINLSGHSLTKSFLQIEAHPGGRKREI